VITWSWHKPKEPTPVKLLTERTKAGELTWHHCYPGQEFDTKRPLGARYYARDDGHEWILTKGWPCSDSHGLFLDGKSLREDTDAIELFNVVWLQVDAPIQSALVNEAARIAKGAAT